MSLSTDDLRSALGEAADHPADATSTARLAGVRSRVARRRRRRATAAGAVGALAVAAVAVGATLGRAPSPAVPAGPRPAATATPADALVLPEVFGPRDVAAQVGGAGDQTPAKVIAWPDAASGLVVACSVGSSLPVTVHLRTTSQDLSTTGACSPDSVDGRFEPQVLDLPAGASGLRPGQQVELQAVLADGASDGSAQGPDDRFVAGVLTGEDLVDLSPLRHAPAGYRHETSAGISAGLLYLDRGPGQASSDDEVVSGLQLVTDGRKAVRLVAHCGGRQQLVVRFEGQGERTLDCPAGERVVRTLDLVPPPGEQRLHVDGRDGDPGALVEVGVYSR